MDDAQAVRIHNRIEGVEKTLVCIKTEQARHGERIETLCTHVDQVATTIHTSLFGNGRSGINTRLDRLEQGDKKQTWTRRTLLVSAISVFGTLMAAAIIAVATWLITKS